MEESRLNRRISFTGFWHALGRGTLLGCYGVWWAFVVLGAVMISVFALTVTWNLGPARLLGWNSLAFYEVLSVILFGWTVYLVGRAYAYIRRRLKKL